ncbi:MAG: carbonic anhydrase [Saprospiraceae bacterium]|nr:carbonic anhydrase [Saprospiraceae bacterium]
MAETAKGQQPFAIIITCSGSRVSPEIIFGEGIGDLFVIRNAGNLVEVEDVPASVEYAVEHLNVKTALVLGHEHCGAIEAMIREEQDAKAIHLNNVIAQIRSEPEEQQALRVNAQSSDTLIHRCVMANVAHGMDVLQKEIRHKWGEEVTIVGGVYDIETDVVSFMDKPSPKSVQPQ